MRVQDGVVVLEREQDIDLRLEDLAADVAKVEGVVAVHAVGDPADDRARWPSL